MNATARPTRSAAIAARSAWCRDDIMNAFQEAEDMWEERLSKCPTHETWTGLFDSHDHFFNTVSECLLTDNKKWLKNYLAFIDYLYL